MFARNHADLDRCAVHENPEGYPSPGGSFRRRVLLILTLALAATVVMLGWTRIPQDPAYHHFADQRRWLGFPNFFNVLSNLPFIIVGVRGLHFLWRGRTMRPAGFLMEAGERRLYTALFGGVALVGLGSMYYHWSPGNDRLVWDRLPMTVVFMAFLSATVAERISSVAGRRLLVALIVVGIGSVLYWRWGDLRGAGDLRFYILVQFFPMLALPLIWWLFPARDHGNHELSYVVGWYGLAKVFELLDARLFALGGLISGHTLKHLAAAMAVFILFRVLKKRHTLDPTVVR